MASLFRSQFSVRINTAIRRSVSIGRRAASHQAASSVSGAPPIKRFGSLALAGVLVGTTSYTLGSVYPPTVVELAFPRPAPPSPAAQSDEGIKIVAAIEEQLNQLPLVQGYRAKTAEYYETRPYSSYPEEKRIHSLTAGTLSGPGKFAVRPLIFVKWDESENVGFVHVGRSLCGHDGIIHGGLLATILDESLARVALMNLPSKIGVTASLTINYKAPTRADQFIVVRTKVEEVKGRKAVVSGRIEDLSGKLLVEASAVFVEPKYANMLKADAVAAVMGARPKTGHPIVGVDVAVTS